MLFFVIFWFGSFSVLERFGEVFGGEIQWFRGVLRRLFRGKLLDFLVSLWFWESLDIFRDFWIFEGKTRVSLFGSFRGFWKSVGKNEGVGEGHGFQ